MNLRHIILVLLLQVGLHAAAQTEFAPVDMKLIQDSLTNETYGVPYAKLLKRLDALDTTLTQAEFRLAYYGWGLQKDYNGYSDIDQNELNPLFKSDKAKDHKKALAICNAALKEAPVNLDANFYKLIAVKMLDKNDPDIVGLRYRVRGLIRAVMGSGDGLTCETGFKVMFISDEYHLMWDVIEIEEMQMQALVGNCDKMTVKPGDYYPQDEIYFDIEVPFGSLGKMLKGND